MTSDNARIQAITVGDVNGDGNPDLVAATYDSGKSGTCSSARAMAPSRRPRTFYPGPVPTSVTIADLGSQVTLP